MQKYTIFCLTLLRTDDEYGIIGREYTSMPIPLSCSRSCTLYFYDLDSIYVAENFMVGYRLVFDRENLKFGWSNANCKYLKFTAYADLKF